MARTLTVSTDLLSILPSEGRALLRGYEVLPTLTFQSVPRGEVAIDQWRLGDLVSRFQASGNIRFSVSSETDAAVASVLDWTAAGSAFIAQGGGPVDLGWLDGAVALDRFQSLLDQVIESPWRGQDSDRRGPFQSDLPRYVRIGLQRERLFATRNSPWGLRDFATATAQGLMASPGAVMLASDGPTTSAIAVTGTGIFIGYVVIPVARGIGHGLEQGLETVVRDWVLKLRPRVAGGPVESSPPPETLD